MKRLNITLPEELTQDLENIPNKSRFIVTSIHLRGVGLVGTGQCKLLKFKLFAKPFSGINRNSCQLSF